MRLPCLLLMLAAVAARAEAPPFDPAEARDASTLALRVVQDWRAEANPPRRTKIVEIAVAEWWPGQTVRIPVVFVAPPERTARIVVGNVGLRAPAKAPLDERMRALLPRGVGFVLAGIGPIEAMEPAEKLNDEMNRRFLGSRGDARYTPAWLWGMSYMRALTAALAETAVFEPGKVAVSGGSKRGVASAACGIWDDRFTAMAPVVAPPHVAPSGMFAWPPDSPEVVRVNERFLADVRAGKGSLDAEARRNVLAFEERNARYKLSLDDFRKAGWTDGEVARAAQRIDRLYLLSENIPAAHRPGLDILYINGTNDSVTPGVLETGQLYPPWPVVLIPGGQHGSAGMGFTRLTPRLPEVERTIDVFFARHFFGEPGLPEKPALNASRIGDELFVAVQFPERGPAPDGGEIHWSFDRAPAGTWQYQYSGWRSAPLERVSDRGWQARIPLPAGVRMVDLLSFHLGPNGAAVSSNSTRSVLNSERQPSR